jgi:hypothetical protein
MSHSHGSELASLRAKSGRNSDLRQTLGQGRLAKENRMSSSSIRKHAGSGAANAQAIVPEPSFSERARTLMYLGRIGSLSTLSRKQPGFPFGSVMPYGLDDQGRPIFLISTMAMHTQNLQADSRASPLVTQPDASGDLLGASRVTVMENVRTISEAEVSQARQLYLEPMTLTQKDPWFRGGIRLESLTKLHSALVDVKGWVPLGTVYRGFSNLYTQLMSRPSRSHVHNEERREAAARMLVRRQT